MAGGTTLLADPGQLRDLGVYLARLVRLDSGALVRLRRLPGDKVAVWSWTPLEVLALRGIHGVLSVADSTVRADALLVQVRAAVAVRESGSTAADATVELPAAQDMWWRGPLPPSGHVLETISAAEVDGVLAAAESTFRQASAVAAVPQRAGEALLDHVAFTVSAETEHAEVGVRQLIAAARLGFLPGADLRVGRAGQWTFLATRHGLIYRTATMPLLS